MDYSLNEQEEMIKTSARDFLTAECPRSLVRQTAEEDRSYPVELWQKIAELGWMGLVLPEKYGGSGCRFIDLAVLLEETGRACLPVPFFSTAVLGGITIQELGSEAQKQEFLPKIARGQTVVTLALTEPEGDYHIDNISLEAGTKGNNYVLNGVKILVPDAYFADYILCVAKAAEGTGLFIVTGKSPGVTVTPLKTIAGDKQCEVVFHNVEVSEESVLGEVGKVATQLQDILARAAVAKCAEMVGGAQQVLEMTVDYVKERKQFGVPVGSFQAVQHHCANIKIDVDTSRFLTYQAAWRISEGLPYAREAAMAKGWVSEAYKRVVKLGHQCIGGVSVIEDHDMPLYSKRAKAAELTLGDADFHREVVAQLLGL